MTSTFDKEYLHLNKNQKTAVDQIEGPVMVLAGPGTGKTQVLTLRIANILRKTDTSPSSILALTFTDAAAQEMKQRLVNLIGQPAYLVQISTFHAFCQRIISSHPEKFIISKYTLQITDVERAFLLQQILTTLKLKILRPSNAPDLYLRSIEQAIKNLKREGINPISFSRRVRLSKTQPDKNQELALIYRAYQKNLKKLGRYDYEDMINLVNQQFKKNKELLLSYQEQINFFLVDEYQDTNSAQNKLLFNLASYWGKKANLFVVGDPHQSIFRFQGASLENTKEFISRFPGSILINLDQNYRSTQLILDSAHNLISKNSQEENFLKHHSLIANTNYKTEKIKSINLPNYLFENFFLARQIKKDIKNGLKPQEIAVIATTNQDLLELSDVLTKFKIPYTVKGGKDILSDPYINQLLLLFKLINNLPRQHLDTQFFTLLNFDFLKLNPLDILTASKLAFDKRLPLDSFIFSHSNKLTDGLKRFSRLFLGWQKAKANQTLPQFFQTVLTESGFLNNLLAQPDSAFHLLRLSTLFDLAKTLSRADTGLTLEIFLTNLQSMKSLGLKLNQVNLNPDGKAVTITTVHKAKGLEWQKVYFYRCVDGKWGNSKKSELIHLPPNLLEFDKQEQDPIQEERRLFYVSLTRAKQQLVITSAGQYQTVYGSKFAIPSIFLQELPEKYLKTLPIKQIVSKEKQILQLFLSPTKNPPSNKKEKAFLKTLTTQISLSPTSLNTYLDCPYKFKLNNLYRVPKTKAVYLCFGTAVHSALEDFYSVFIRTGKKPSLNLLLNLFRQALQREILSSVDKQAKLLQGKNILTAYYRQINTNHPLPIKTEIKLKAKLKEIQLSGKIDRIDKLSNNHLRIVDYKTGRPKTKGEVEGTTKNSTGQLKRQLVFYKLLADLDPGLAHKVKELELDFVEKPHLKNKSGQMTFAVTQKEIDELKTTIKNTAKAISNLNFRRTEDSSLCRRCDFFTHCYPQNEPG